ncbi:MAG: zf-HC2 domain-containing protein [Gemmatimonadota bacterium]|nr:zf-HC2 domain-containing protein [Gemmatimonadota bacterium]
MQHLDEGTIHAWLDGALDVAEASHAEAHVAGCGECAAAVAEARGLTVGASRILSALDTVPGGVLPGDARAPTTATAPQATAPFAGWSAHAVPRRLGWRWHPRAVIRIAAMVALVAAGSLMVVRQERPGQGEVSDAVLTKGEGMEGSRTEREPAPAAPARNEALIATVPADSALSPRSGMALGSARATPRPPPATERRAVQDAGRADVAAAPAAPSAAEKAAARPAPLIEQEAIVTGAAAPDAGRALAVELAGCYEVVAQPRVRANLPPRIVLDTARVRTAGGEAYRLRAAERGGRQALVPEASRQAPAAQSMAQLRAGGGAGIVATWTPTGPGALTFEWIDSASGSQSLVALVEVAEPSFAERDERDASRDSTGAVIRRTVCPAPR